MTNELPSMRAADVEVKGLSDGILKTSLDRVIGMERASRLFRDTDGCYSHGLCRDFLVGVALTVLGVGMLPTAVTRKGNDVPFDY